MSVLRRIGLWAGLVGLALWVTGCSSTSPIMLQLPSARGGTADLPLKVGVTTAEKTGEQKLSKIDTCAELGVFHFYAKMPRRSEPEYFSRSVGDYLRDTKVFSYCYDDPFDHNDVDLVLRMKMKDFLIDNTALGTTLNHLSLIPYAGLCVTLYMVAGLPQETFLIRYNLEMTLETTAGKEIARYETSGSGSEGVNIYEQPFGNYLWYGSIFQKEFFKAMDYFVGQMKNDRAKIMQAAGK